MGERESEFAEWLSGMMTARHMTTADLARKIEVPGSTVSKWRLGRYVPDTLNCRMIAAAFGIPVKEVMLRAGHADPDDIEDMDPVRTEMRQLLNVMSPEQLAPYLPLFRALAGVPADNDAS